MPELSTVLDLASFDGATAGDAPIPSCVFALHKAAIVDVVVETPERVLSKAFGDGVAKFTCFVNFATPSPLGAPGGQGGRRLRSRRDVGDGVQKFTFSLNKGTSEHRAPSVITA